MIVLLRRRLVQLFTVPVRAERLAAARITFALVLLADQALQYLPSLALLFGPRGFAPRGADIDAFVREWRWTELFFPTGSMAAIGALFAAWMLATLALLVGWHTRVAAAATWFGALCFINRNPLLKNQGDEVLLIALFLLMLAPCGEVFSLDRNRRGGTGSSWTAPWAVRLLQLQLAVIYFASGLAKLRGHTWLDGTSIHFTLNEIRLARWSYAQLPVPYAITAALTWATLAFELGFPLLMLWKPARKWVLWVGVGLHLGIFATLELGMFSFYMMAMYLVWLRDDWWLRKVRLVWLSDDWWLRKVASICRTRWGSPQSTSR